MRCASILLHKWTFRCSSDIYWKDYPHPQHTHRIVSAPLSEISWAQMSGLIPGPCSILSTCKSLFTPEPWGWRLCSTLCNQEGWVLQHHSCISRVFLAFLGSLNIHENDEITLSLSAEKICVKSVGQLGNITCHSTTWSFPAYDHELPPSFLDFFKQCFIVFKSVRFTLSWLISL